MSKEMMICKHWKTCEEYFCIRHKPHRCGNIGDGHICNPADWKRDKCNSKCIPYIPEQPKKPTCQEKERRINLTLVIKGDTISIE